MITPYSRHKHDDLIKGDSGRTSGLVFTATRPKFHYTGDTGEIPYVVEAGDSLATLAARYFGGMGLSLPSLLYWAIADFQPEPLLDPTIDLTPGTIVYIPSAATLQAWLMRESSEQPSRLA